MCKKHTRDAEIRPFCPGFCLKSLSFLSFSEKCKNQGSFCKCLIINKNAILHLTEHGGSYENGACFYQPPFLSGKFTLKILTLQTYLVGGKSENAGKFQAYRHKELVNRNSKIADGNCSAQVQPDASIGLVQ